MQQLRLGHTSRSKLEKDIEGITQKMLLEQLKEWIAFGLVDKKTYEGFPKIIKYYGRRFYYEGL